MKRQCFSLIGLAVLLITGCANTNQRDVEATLFNPDHTGIRWGLVVADMNGEELIAVKAADRFTPASNTKVFTTMAAYHHLEALKASAKNPGTQVFVEHLPDEAPPRLVLKGGGDATLQDAPDCETTCLATLADQVASWGLNEVSSVVGDDTLFPFERWGPGWSQEDLTFYYGTAISALSVNDNLVWIDVSPGDAAGDLAMVSWQAGDDYYELDNQLRTAPEEGDWAMRIERLPGEQTVRFYGEIPVGSAQRSYRLAIDNPADYTAWRFKNLLEARGISVGTVETRHRPLSLADEAPDPDETDGVAALASHSETSSAAASLPAGPLRDSLKRISKDSENLHADIALRRLGLLNGTGSRDYGVAELKAFLTEAGLSEQGYAVHGGSGMSIYNRISPRSMVQLIAFAAEQPWFDAWLADQPIGGVDGSLKRRFTGTALEGKIFAKTGTLNGANALSGVMIAESGRKLIFSIIANDRPTGTRSAIAEMDAALVEIAARY
ncbi:MAG: D-alanyl-D-alanine carboxypeptidase/D-alanyl-D-alanine-endopeptidase [Henriciella sp.]|nr:D-alanyl-D-alanine carboxypeptidase/D-alanyl-D-alanine-endopeptidase [Henriciella sp.]